ncbi:MAG: hypothetical protein AB1374_08930 [Bacillota bacterium]
MKKETKEVPRQHEEEALLTFLKQTKDGKYAKIDENLLRYLRVEPQRCCLDEEYYYSLR